MAFPNRIGDTKLTEGVIWKKLMVFFVPILLGSFFQQLYSVADAVIVGQFVGKGALAAVDSTSSLIRLFTNMFIGISTGATIIISQYYGGERYRDVSEAVHTGIAFAVAGGAFVTVAGIAAARAGLQAISVPQDILEDAVDYTRIYFAGMIPSLVYNIGSGILRAVGDSRRPFYFLVVASLTNIALDILFVWGFGWGVKGAAIATVISQVISACLVVATLARSTQCYQLIFRKIRFAGPMLKRIVATGLPIAFQATMYPLANILIQASVNHFGTDTIAAWAVSGKLDFVIWTLLDAFGITISTFAAQNFGAGKIDRINKGLRVWLFIALGVIGGISAVLFLWGGPLSSLFIKDDAVVSLTRHVLRLLAPFYIFYIFIELLSGVIRGTGETFKPMLITLFGICVLRIGWLIAVVPLHNTLDTVVVSFPITWLVTAVIYIIYFQHFRRRRLSPSKEREALPSD